MSRQSVATPRRRRASTSWAAPCPASNVAAPRAEARPNAVEEPVERVAARAERRARAHEHGQHRDQPELPEHERAEAGHPDRALHGPVGPGVDRIRPRAATADTVAPLGGAPNGRTGAICTLPEACNFDYSACSSLVANGVGGDLAPSARPVTAHRGRHGTSVERSCGADARPSVQSGDMDLGELARAAVVRGSGVDVARSRERTPPAPALEAVRVARAARRLLLLPDRDVEPDPPRPAAHDADADADLPADRPDRAARPRDRRADDVGREVAARALRPERDRRHAWTTSSASGRCATRSSRRSTCSSATRRSASTWVATRARRSCSRGRPVPARRTWPRRWRARPACRSCSCRRPRSSRCTTARPAARSATTSRSCARRRAKRAARSASSRRSTRSPARAAACAARRSARRATATRRSSAARRAKASPASSTSC